MCAAGRKQVGFKGFKRMLSKVLILFGVAICPTRGSNFILLRARSVRKMVALFARGVPLFFYARSLANLKRISRECCAIFLDPLC
jgi:hypothetical protein